MYFQSDVHISVYSDQKYKHNTFAFHELKRDVRLFLCPQKAYLAHMLYTNELNLYYWALLAR